MRLHRFYVAQAVIKDGKITLDSREIINQIRNVFRLREGDQIIIFSGLGFDHYCLIVCMDNNEVVLKILETKKSCFMPEREMVLCTAIIKKDKFEWIVEKATEIGVTRIIPIVSERSEKKGLNISRLQKIAIEASEQSGRGNIPIIDPIVEFSKFNWEKGKDGIDIVFHTQNDGESMEMIEKKLKNRESIRIFVGPEGGWSEKEIEMFHKREVSICCLGSQILKSETAVVAGLSILTFLCKTPRL